MPLGREAAPVWANLLPGVRELRAPLAAGYLWLAAWWIAFAGDVPSRGQATGLAHVAYLFIDKVSPVGFAVAVGFVAYLIGVLSVALADWLVKQFPKSDKLEESLVRRIPMSAKLVHLLPNLQLPPDLNRFVRGELNRAVRHVPKPNPNADDTQHLAEFLRLGTEYKELARLDSVDQATPVRRLRRLGVHVDRFAFAQGGYDTETGVAEPHYDQWLDVLVLTRIAEEFDRIVVRMVGKDQEMYQVIDRASAEAQFRWAVALAIVPVAVAVAYQEYSTNALVAALGGIGLLLAAVLLWRRGSIQKRQARSYIVDALVLRRVVAPTLDPLQPLFEQDTRDQELRDQELREQERREFLHREMERREQARQAELQEQTEGQQSSDAQQSDAST